MVEEEFSWHHVVYRVHCVRVMVRGNGRLRKQTRYDFLPYSRLALIKDGGHLVQRGLGQDWGIFLQVSVYYICILGCRT